MQILAQAPLEELGQVGGPVAVLAVDPLDLGGVGVAHGPDQIEPPAPVHRSVPHRQPLAAVPHVTRIHLEAFGRAAGGAQGLQRVRRRGLGLVHPHQPIGQQGEPARERHRVARPDGDGPVDEVAQHRALLAPRVHALGRHVLDLVALRERARGAEALKRDVEGVASPEKLKERQLHVGVPALQRVVGVQHRGRGIGQRQHAVVAHLHAGDPGGRGQRHLAGVGQLEDLAVAETAQLGHQPVVIELGHQHGHVTRQLLERGLVEMVAVQVRDVDVVERRQLPHVGRNIRQVPPAPEVRRPQDPRVHQDPHVLRLAQERAVAEHGHTHARTILSRLLGGLTMVRPWISVPPHARPI